LQQIDIDANECQALVLAPTRELAQQIQKVWSKWFRDWVKFRLWLLYLLLGRFGSRWLHGCAMPRLHWWNQCSWRSSQTVTRCPRCRWNSWSCLWHDQPTSIE
jgi:hypothetical protein